MLNKALLAALVLALPAHAEPPKATDADRREVGAQLFGHPLEADDEDLVLSPWTAATERDLWVAASFADERTVVAGVFRHVEGAWKLVAKSAPVAFLDGYEPANRPPSLVLDLIPYRIAPREVAFGVRVASTWNASHRAGSAEELRLFVLRATGLPEVFSAVTSETRDDASDDDAEPSSWTANRVVIITKALHADHFDLILRDKATKAETTCAWSGMRYAPVKPRPKGK